MNNTFTDLSKDKFISLWMQKHRDRFGSGTRFDLDACENEYKTFCKIVDRVKSSNIYTQFSRSKFWMINLLVLGELQKVSYYNETNITGFATFDKKNNDIRVSEEKMYSFLLVMYDYLIKSNNDEERGFGFPKWLKFDDFVEFTRNLYDILNSNKMCESIFYLPSNKDVVVTQEDALRFAKKKTTLFCLNYCKKYSPGKWLAYFKDLDAFQRAVDKFYNHTVEYFTYYKLHGAVTIEEAKNILHKKRRINKKTCEAYLRYQAYLACMSTRLGKPLEIAAAKERNVFCSGYSILRDSLCELGWIKCVDSTYCVGVRCRTYQSRVCADKGIKIQKVPTYNKSEIKILRALKSYDRSHVIDYYGEYKVISVEERKKYIDSFTDSQEISTSVKRSFGRYMWSFGDYGQDLVVKQWFNSSDRQHWQDQKKRIAEIQKNYVSKYSCPRQFVYGEIRSSKIA